MNWTIMHFLRSKHLFAFHSIHKYVLASTLVPFGGPEGQSAPCPSPGFRGGRGSAGSRRHAPGSLTCTCVTPPPILSPHGFLPCISTLPPPSQTQDDPILRPLTSLHLQRSFFQARSHSQALGVKTWVYFFGGIPFNLLEEVQQSSQEVRAGKHASPRLGLLRGWGFSTECKTHNGCGQ